MDKSEQNKDATQIPAMWETATFGLGCFWSPDAYYGHLPGVVRTRVGYAGGTSSNPSYREMGDHTETVQLDYDPNQISYGQLLSSFWERHNPDNLKDYKGNQYRSLIVYHDEGQRESIRKHIHRLELQGQSVQATTVAPYGEWYKAEDRHQKYYLKRYPDALAKVSEQVGDESELVDSTLAARLNGIAKGFTSGERLRVEIADWPIGREEHERLLALIGSIKW